MSGDTTDNAADGVRKWLSQEGFPLEMRAARAFRRNPALGVTQGDYYYDEDAAGRTVPREIDLTVSRTVSLADMMVMSVVATVECKSLPADRQLVAFRAHGAPTDMAIFTERPATKAGGVWLRKLWIATQSASITVPLMVGRAPQAYALTTTWQRDKDGNPKGGDRDLGYKALESAATAAADIVNAWGGPPSKRTKVIGFAIPLVVISGRLFLADLADDSDEPMVQETDRVQVLWKHPVGGAPTTVVDVVTEEALPSWVAEFSSTATAIVEGQGHGQLARDAARETSRVVAF